MTGHSARRWTVLGALAAVVLAAGPAGAQTRAAMEFPPTGSRWISRSIDPNGGSRLGTYTVLEPGSFQGTAGFRISDEIDVLFFERTSHFATHGELNENDPLASGLLLAPGGKDDGRLEVREIFGLDLTAQLVVLSACETGLGQLSTGDELIGLQRAFLYAGTPAVVTTLWKVDDRASFVLMREFYDRLAKTDPGLALQAAQRAAMKEFPHPFAWAAFGLTGVGR
jgi:hypothetical protein